MALNARWQALVDAMDGKSLSDYFHIPGRYRLQRNDHEIVLHATYDQVPPKVDLPVELALYVASFLYAKRICTVRGRFENYPFTPPVWSVVRANFAVRDAVTLLNAEYRTCWTPEVSLEADLLHLLLKLLHV
jgi:hypothetical protein